MKLVHEVVNCENYSDNYSDYSDSDEQEFYVHTVNSFSSQPEQVFVTLSIGTFSKCMDIDCKIDTGSQINCLPNSTFKRLKISNPLEPSNATYCIHRRSADSAWENKFNIRIQKQVCQH